MKLLFDEILSHRLVELLAPEFLGSAHPRQSGMRGASDMALWEYAREKGFAIVSKNNDFRQCVFLEGPPPKVIWLAIGNAGTAAIAAILRSRVAHIVPKSGGQPASTSTSTRPRSRRARSVISSPGRRSNLHFEGLGRTRVFAESVIAVAKKA
jgi:predicted nuclease of predicted toxin-antitoxin system